MESIEIIQASPQLLKEEIISGVKNIIESLKKDFQPKEPTELLTRKEVADMFNINLTTLHNWTKKGMLKSYGIGSRVYYKRNEVEQVLKPLN